MKKYIIKKAFNGYIVVFDHIDKSYLDENLRVANTLEEVKSILANDLRVEEKTKSEKKKI